MYLEPLNRDIYGWFRTRFGAIRGSNDVSIHDLLLEAIKW